MKRECLFGFKGECNKHLVVQQLHEHHHDHQIMQYMEYLLPTPSSKRAMYNDAKVENIGTMSTKTRI